MSKITYDKNSKKKNNTKNYRQSNPIIYGYFPRKTYKELAIERVNKTLCGLLFILILVSVASYYFVTASEVELNKIGRETIKLNNENTELQNKLDYIHSFNNVEQVVRQKNLLNTAKQVIEVPAPKVSAPVQKTFSFSTMPANKWSVGY